MDPAMMNAPPPPPPSYASATQDIGGYAGGYAPHQSSGAPIHSPTRRGPPMHDGGDGFSESIDPAKYKTRLCQAFIMGTNCTFGNRCAFAHGNQELRHSSSPVPSQLPPVAPSHQHQAPPPPPPSYNDFHQQHHYSPGPSSPLHSRPQTPRGGPVSGGGGTADGLLSPTRGVHPRNSLPGSPVTAGDQLAYPTAATQRFRNEPYSPTGFVFQGSNGGEGEKQE